MEKLLLADYRNSNDFCRIYDPAASMLVFLLIYTRSVLRNAH